MMKRLFKKAANDHKLFDALTKAFKEASICENNYCKWLAREEGDCWRNGKPVWNTETSEEIYDKVIYRAGKAVTAIERLRKEYGIKYDRRYDFKDDQEKIALALWFSDKMNEACQESLN